MKIKKYFYALYLVSFYFFTYGKFFVIGMTVIKFISDLMCVKINRGLYKSYKYFLAVFVIFLISFISAIFQGNDILHIIRNNFFTLVFIVTGIQAAYAYRNNYVNFFSYTIKIIGLLATFQAMVYIFSTVSPQFHVYLDDVLLKKAGYTMSFAGLGNEGAGFGFKMVTMLTSLYLFLIPFVFFVKAGNLKFFLFVITFIVIASGSITQYAALIFYVLVFYLRLFASPLKLFKNIFSLKIMLTILCVVVFVVQSGLGSVLEEKANNVLNVDYSNKLTPISLRIVQAKVLLEEFSESPIFGKGLGYDSKEYRRVRDEMHGAKKINKYNYSMYENQYLDILMKFGMVGAPAIYFLFLIYPIYKLFRMYMVSKNELYFAVLVGYCGLAIYAGSNGNTFYVYTTMFVWGIVIYLISSGIQNVKNLGCSPCCINVIKCSVREDLKT